MVRPEPSSSLVLQATHHTRQLVDLDFFLGSELARDTVCGDGLSAINTDAPICWLSLLCILASP
jgi:hypothetical protein